MTACSRPAGDGRDEPVRGVAGGDGREPGPDADVLVQQRGGVQPGLLGRAQDRRGGQDGQQPGRGPSFAPHGADHHAACGQDDQDARPVPGAGQHHQRRARVRHRGQDVHLEPVEVVAPADQQARAQQRDHRAQHDGGAPQRDPAARRRERAQHRQHHHQHIEQDRRIRRGAGQGQRGARRDHAARQHAPVPGPQHAPGRQRHQKQGQGLIRGERAQVQGRAQHGEQRGGEERRPPPVAVPGRAPQQRGRAQHEDQRQRSAPRPGRPRGPRARRAAGRSPARRRSNTRTAGWPCRAASSPTAGARPTGTGPHPGARCRPRPGGASAASGRSAPAAAATRRVRATGWAGQAGARAVRSATSVPARGLRRRRELLPGCARGDVCLHGRSPPPPAHDVRNQTPTRLPGTPAARLAGTGPLTQVSG